MLRTIPVLASGGIAPARISLLSFRPALWVRESVLDLLQQPNPPRIPDYVNALQESKCGGYGDHGNILRQLAFERSPPGPRSCVEAVVLFKGEIVAEVDVDNPDAGTKILDTGSDKIDERDDFSLRY